MKEKKICGCGKIPIIEHNKRVFNKVFAPPGW